MIYKSKTLVTSFIFYKSVWIHDGCVLVQLTACWFYIIPYYESIKILSNRLRLLIIWYQVKRLQEAQWRYTIHLVKPHNVYYFQYIKFNDRIMPCTHIQSPIDSYLVNNCKFLCHVFSHPVIFLKCLIFSEQSQRNKCYQSITCWRISH